MDENNIIDQNKLDLVARAGGNYYSRIKNSFFEIPKPLQTKGIGVDSFPGKVRNSSILTGNNLGMLGNVESLPSINDVNKFLGDNPKYLGLELNEKHKFAQELLKDNDVLSAWKVLLS